MVLGASGGEWVAMDGREMEWKGFREVPSLSLSDLTDPIPRIHTDPWKASCGDAQSSGLL